MTSPARTIARLRLAVVALSSLIVGAVLWGAAQPSADREPLARLQVPADGAAFFVTELGYGWVVSSAGIARRVTWTADDDTLVRVNFRREPDSIIYKRQTDGSFKGVGTLLNRNVPVADDIDVLKNIVDQAFPETLK